MSDSYVVQADYEPISMVGSSPLACCGRADYSRLNGLLKNSEIADSSHALTAQARLRAARNDKIKDLVARLTVVPSDILRDFEHFQQTVKPLGMTTERA